MITDPIADILTRIRNAQRVGHHTVRVRESQMGQRILQVLKDEGFILDFSSVKDEGASFGAIEVSLKYDGDGQPVIQEARRASRPGRRMYAGKGDLPQVHHGLGIALISTSQGVLSDRIARQKEVGGEVLAFIR